jgi:hypothetical protein
LPYLLYFQCHINVFIIFFSFHSQSLSSFHFISSVCSIKVAFLMPHSVFYCCFSSPRYLLLSLLCAMLVLRGRQTTLSRRERGLWIIIPSLQMSTIETIWNEISTQCYFTDIQSFTCQLWWNWGTLKLIA